MKRSVQAFLRMHCFAYLFIASTTVFAQLDPGGVSVDLGKCEYSKATGASEQLTESKGEWISARFYPMAFLDNLVCLPEKTVFPVTFSLKNIRKERPTPAYLFLKLPKGFSVMGTTRRAKLLEKKSENGSTIYKFEERVHSIGKYYSEVSAISLLLKSDLPAGEESYPAEYWMEYQGKSTIPYTTQLKILPAFHAAQPKIFKTGVPVNNEGVYIGKEAQLFTDFYKDCGFNAVHYTGNILSKEMKEAGVERSWQYWDFGDAYNLGKYGSKKPEYAKFRLVDGGVASRAQGLEGICPIEVYINGEYFRKYVIAYIEDSVLKNDTADHVMVNWEPYMFDFKGCFCEGCKEEFIGHTKMPRAEVEKKWPKDIIASYKKQWVKFRSWQHAQLVDTIQREFDKLGKKYGKPFYLIPEISWASLFPEGEEMFGQYLPADYIDKISWIEPWGPYIFQEYDKPYQYQLGIHLNTYLAGLKVKSRIAELVKDPQRRPHVIGFPQALQCGTWVTEPEALGFETIAFFLAGYEGSIAYSIFLAYDYRYWKELAKANDTIARYEDYVFKGRPDSRIEIKPETPVPGPAEADENAQISKKILMQDLAKYPLVLGRSYRLGDKWMVAVGNFWEKGEAFVRMRVPDLAKNSSKYVVWQPEKKQCVGNAEGNTALSAEELKQGILLHAGALRWEFYTVEPYESGKDYGKVLSSSWMEKEKSKRLAAIQTAYNWEIARKKDMPDIVVYSFAELPEVKSGKISAIPRDGMNSAVLTIKTPVYSLDLDMGAGGRIVNWQCGEDKLASSVNNFTFGSDAFWSPENAVDIIKQPYRLIEMVPVENGVKVTLEHKISGKENAFLRGLVIRKTYTFEDNVFTLSVSLINKSAKSLTVGYRIHNTPASLARNGTQSGTAFMKKSNGEPLVYRRGPEAVFFRHASNSSNGAPFNIKEAGTINSDIVEIHAPWLKHGIKIEFFDDKEFKGFVYWDSNTATTSSLEAIFNKTEIPVNETKNYSGLWSLIPAKRVPDLQ